MGPRSLATAAAGAAILSLLSVPAQASPPSRPDAAPWVVSLGDSYISGEAGRWAGNESLTSAHIDALGQSAYWDDGDRESIPHCHRSKSAAIGIGVVSSLNLACSGAVTSTMVDDDGNFKPGIDFAKGPRGSGQAAMLEDFAREHDVRMVALSIGGNDFHFADIVEQCVKDYLKPFSSALCQNDRDVQGHLDDYSVAKVRAAVRGAIAHVAQAMENAGATAGEWTLAVQLYPQPTPLPGAMRYPESGYSRQVDGGCGLKDSDLTWAARTALPLINATVLGAVADARAQLPGVRIVTMDTSEAFRGRELCNDAVWRVRETHWWVRKGPDSWRSPGAADNSEWVREIRIINGGDTTQQESFHPNYWGQLALRNCWRQAWNNGDVRGGSCQRGHAGLNSLGEPRMDLVPSAR